MCVYIYIFIFICIQTNIIHMCKIFANIYQYTTFIILNMYIYIYIISISCIYIYTCIHAYIHTIHYITLHDIT